MNVTDYIFENTSTLETDLVSVNGTSMTYSEVYDKITLLSRYLRDRYGEDNKIILMCTNTPFFIIAYFAIMKSGNVCVPLDTNTKQPLLEWISDICQSPCIITEERIAASLPDLDGEILLNTDLTGIEERAGEFAPIPEDEDFDGSRLVEIIFTSGSTAKPKGVMLTHDNLIANTSSIVTYLGLTADDKMLVVLPFHYCYGLSLLHTHARVGGSLVLNNTFFFTNTVIRDLLNHECTGFAGVPSHFQILLRKTPKFKETDFPHLRYVTQAGGQLAHTFLREFSDAFPDISFFVMYGQTEATARLSYLPPEMLRDKLGSIGKGIPGVTLEVRNGDNSTVKPGQVGEIYARGGNVMAGYLMDEELTAKTIVDGWLKTGDLATVDEDGYIFVVAREKEIIKVGGERVSPREIEEVIDTLPGVVDSSAIGIPDDIFGEAVKVYVVLNDEYANIISPADIKRHCEQNLPKQKVPAHIEIIDRIPVNAVGKKVKALVDSLNEVS